MELVAEDIQVEVRTQTVQIRADDYFNSLNVHSLWLVVEQGALVMNISAGERLQQTGQSLEILGCQILSRSGMNTFKKFMKFFFCLENKYSIFLKSSCIKITGSKKVSIKRCPKRT